MGARAKRQPLSQGWMRFAENVVESAGILDDAVAQTLCEAFASVPRDKFVAPAFNLRATEDTALPIGFGQTISKPSSVARMLGLIGLEPGMRILEVGCGSGYCSAVMAAAGAQVFAVEYVGLLAQKTRRLLDTLNFHNILVRTGDGRRGWREHAPFDAIAISTAFEQIDPALLEQLRNPGGRMVAPVGNSRGQILCFWEAKAQGVVMYNLEASNFIEGK